MRKIILGLLCIYSSVAYSESNNLSSICLSELSRFDKFGVIVRSIFSEDSGFVKDVISSPGVIKCKTETTVRYLNSTHMVIHDLEFGTWAVVVIP